MTKTTLKELTHRYAAVLRKCAILNAMALGVIIATPSNAATVTGNLDIAADQSYYIPEEGMNLDKLTMTSNSELIWGPENTEKDKEYYGYNNVNIDDATFSGKIDMGYATGDGSKYIHVIHTTNTTFDNVEVVGHKNPDATTNVNWGDYSSFWSNALTLTNNVKMTDTQVGMMSPAEVKTNDFFAYKNDKGETVTPEYFDIEVGGSLGSKVVYNGGLYEIKTAGSYTKALHDDIKENVDSGTLVKVDEMDQFAPLVGSGISYDSGDVFLVSDTNKSLRDAGLIDPTDETTTILAYQVKENKTYTSLTPIDMLDEKIKPVSQEAGVSIVGKSADKMANIKLYHSSISSFGANTDDAALLTIVNGYKQLQSSLLTKLQSATDEKDIDLRNKLSTTEIGENNFDDFWNKLRLYDGENKDIITAYKIAEATHDQYREAETKSGALPYTIRYANLEIGNNSDVALETSGEMFVDHSNISIWGVSPSKEATRHDGDAGKLMRNGKNGSLVIQDSNISLYTNANLIAETEGENDEFITNNSTINLRGSDRTPQIAYEITEDTSVGATIFSTMGLQLTNNSILNAIGGTDGYEFDDDDGETTYSFSCGNVAYLTNSKLDIDALGDWKKGIEKKALYVINSEINVGDENNTPSALSLYHNEGEQETLEGGTIALDLNSEINLFQNSTLTADIASLYTDTDAGVVNFYNNSQLNGTIYRANVFAKDKNTKVNGTLALNNAILDIGKNALEVDILSLDNSTISTHIDTEGNGTIKAGTLEFGPTPSNVKLVVDDTNAISSEGTTIDFMTGTAKEIGNNLTFTNIMYDFKYDSTTGQLKITPNGNSGVVSLNDLNDRLAATTWLSGDFSNGSRAKLIADSLNTWAQENPESFRKAVKQLQPVDPNQGQQIAGENGQQIADVSLHHNNGHTNNGKHNGTGGQNTNGQHKGTQVAGKSAGDSFNNVGMWAQGLYNYAKLNGSDGYTGKTKGIAMGIDGLITDNLKLGIAYAYTTTDVDADASNTDVNTHTGVLYGEYLFGNAFVNAAGTYGYSKYDGSRSGPLGNINSDYHMDSIYGQVMTGYNFNLNNVVLTPETGVRYLWTKTHAYDEELLDQHIDSNTSNTWTGVLGGRANMAFTTEKAIFTPELKLAATYDFKTDKGGSSVHLANGSSYVVEGKPLKRFGVETGASFGMTIDNMDLSLSYEGKFKKDYQDHTGMINFRYNF